MWGLDSGLATPTNVSALEVRESKDEQCGVSPAALTLAIASAKLDASLTGQAEPDVCRAGGRFLKRPVTLEALIETGLTMDSLPDMVSVSPSETSLSPRSTGYLD